MPIKAFWLCVIAVLLSGCRSSLPDPGGNQKEGGEITVFAAASLTEAFSEIADAFELDYPGIEVLLNFAGSQQLALQLEQGASADLFASADSHNMERVVEAGLVEAASVRCFAYNSLVVITPADNWAAITDLNDLARPGVKLVLAGETVPVGVYSREALTKMGADPVFGLAFLPQVLANVVSHEENVKQVVAKVRLGEADVGIVYQTDLTPANRDQLRRIEIPAAFNVWADYPIAVLRTAGQPEMAAELLDFVLGDEGQQILIKWGFQGSNGDCSLNYTEDE